MLDSLLNTVRALWEYLENKTLWRKQPGSVHSSGHHLTDAFMEALQPQAGEHGASLCKWVRANEIYQSWCCNCGRHGLVGLWRTKISVRESIPTGKWYTCLSNDFWKHSAMKDLDNRLFCVWLNVFFIIIALVYYCILYTTVIKNYDYTS